MEPIAADLADDLPPGVPFAIDTDPETARYAPREPRRHLWLRRGLAVLGLVGIAWMAGAAAWEWSQHQYYVGEQDGVVTIFRGVQADIPGIDLSHPYETTNIKVSQLDQFAVVLDKAVITAPQARAVITDGRASITGSFTIDSAKQLADQLKFGALPISFALQTQDNITPQLGEEQLRIGLLAGFIGLLLVVVYSLLQYRALGLVTVASLVVASVITYLSVTVLGTTHGLRLTMAGVTGLIVAIGVTADSFIVYFERIRDEVRDGRPLVAAVETGWKRARRTIIAADAVNFIAALVLYLLASSNVRGFAFTLGLTTLIDLLVVMLFTHPAVQLLARTKFFGGGHKWSGLDPERLGAKESVRYRGRGQFGAPGAQRPPATVGSARLDEGKAQA